MLSITVNAREEAQELLLKTFLDTLQDRIVEQNWNLVFSIPEVIAAPGANLCLITSEYGRVTLQHVRAFVDHFNGANRQSQNSLWHTHVSWGHLPKASRLGHGSGPLLLNVISGLFLRKPLEK